MRIVAGDWGGRPLVAPKGDATRPTSDRVREALFSMLGDVEGWQVLDLFAGTGAVALEALSRGAEGAVCVERARPALAALEANARRLGAEARLEIVPRDARRYAPTPGRRFDLIYADPPWSEAADFALAIAPRVAGWLAPGATLVLERAARDVPPPAIHQLGEPRSRRYGDALLAVYRMPR